MVPIKTRASTRSEHQGKHETIGSPLALSGHMVSRLTKHSEATGPQVLMIDIVKLIASGKTVAVGNVIPSWERVLHGWL